MRNEKRSSGRLAVWYASEHGGFGYIDTDDGQRFFVCRKFIKSGDPRPGAIVTFTARPAALGAKFPQAYNAIINAHSPEAKTTTYPNRHPRSVPLALTIEEGEIGVAAGTETNTPPQVTPKINTARVVDLLAGLEK